MSFDAALADIRRRTNCREETPTRLRTGAGKQRQPFDPNLEQRAVRLETTASGSRRTPHLDCLLQLDESGSAGMVAEVEQQPGHAVVGDDGALRIVGKRGPQVAEIGRASCREREEISV